MLLFYFLTKKGRSQRCFLGAFVVNLWRGGECMKKKKRYPTEALTVTVQALSDRGDGIATYRHPPTRGPLGKKLTLFIPKTVPGDVVQVTVRDAQGRRKATVSYDKLLVAGPWRREGPLLPENEQGGMPLSHMTYEGQLAFKISLIKQTFESQGVDTSTMRPMIGMAKPYRYRNNMELTFGPAGELGMHRQGDYRTVIDLADSWLAPKILVAVKHVLSEWQADWQLPGFDRVKKTGLLRRVRLRYSQKKAALLVALYATAPAEEFRDASAALAERLTRTFPECQGVLWLWDQGQDEQVKVAQVQVLAGQETIPEELGGYTYHIGVDTFFQVNPTQAEKLVATVLDFAAVQQGEQVVDLFCGIGTFSLPLAAQAQDLVGIELVEASIVQARRNAQENGLRNTHFMAADARKGFEELKAAGYEADVLLLNPPRAGAGGKLMRSIGRFAPKRIVYVSCSPKSLAIDLPWLRSFGYEITAIQAIDQFPHTVHVETVVLMSRN